MTDHPFQALLELVRFDQDINHLNDQIEEHKASAEKLQDELYEAQNIREEAKKKARDYKKLVDSQELIIKEIGISVKEKKRRLDSASNYKEMTALQEEIAALHAQEADAEQQLLDSWNKLENAQKESESADRAYEGKQAEIEASITRHRDAIAKIQQEVEEKKNERAPLESKVPDEWREKYSIMRARVSNPIVPVVNDTCSACFYSITSQEVVRLRHKAILQCHGCYRLLYLPEAMA
jgi:predicted  nucleic acid-binding Zn-ribbon protein